MIFKELEVDEPNKWDSIVKIENNQYMCSCSCGNISILSSDDLRYNKTRSCKSCIRKDNSERQREHLEGTIIENWKFKNYLGNHRYVAECLICHRDFNISGNEVKRGRSKSCKECSGSALIDITGQVFGNYKALKYVGKHLWECECLKCGEHVNVTTQHLRNGQCTQCKSCYMKEYTQKLHSEMMNRWTSKKFGELTPLEYDKETDSWLCRCSCGNIGYFRRANLRNGHTKSCGCKSFEIRANTMISKYGDYISKRIGDPRTPEQIQILTDKALFQNLVDNLKNKLGHLPNSKQIAEALGVQRSIATKYASLYNIEYYKGKYSAMELEFIKQFPDAIVHNRSILPEAKELDFYFENAKLAVEMNGDYWHCDQVKLDKNYHQNKTIQCLKHDIQLIHIFEHEWDDPISNKKIIAMIDRLVHKETITYIDINSVEFKEIDVLDTVDFLNTYHINNSSNSDVVDVAVGCYYNNELIGTITLEKVSNNTYIIDRLCWKHYIKVKNGTEELFRLFINNYNPDSVIVYSDMTKFNGNIFTKLGFRIDPDKGIREPDYLWIKPTIKDKITSDSMILSEEELRNLGYSKVYDAGALKMIWTKKEGE